jgi:hypothetical protein
MAALTTKSKLPNVQAPQPRRTITNLQPHESESNAHTDCPNLGLELQHDQPQSQTRAEPVLA